MQSPLFPNLTPAQYKLRKAPTQSPAKHKQRSACASQPQGKLAMSRDRQLAITFSHTYSAITRATDHTSCTQLTTFNLTDSASSQHPHQYYNQHPDPASPPHFTHQIQPIPSRNRHINKHLPSPSPPIPHQIPNQTYHYGSSISPAITPPSFIQLHHPVRDIMVLMSQWNCANTCNAVCMQCVIWNT